MIRALKFPKINMELLVKAGSVTLAAPIVEQPLRKKNPNGLNAARAGFLNLLENRRLHELRFHEEIRAHLDGLCRTGEVVKIGPDLYKANRVRFICSPA